MKRFPSRLESTRIRRLCRRLRDSGSKPCRTSIYEEMEQGAVIGFLAATGLALHFAGDGLTAPLLVFASSLGLFIGAVIGTILWIGSAELPEDVVRTPAPGQSRSKNPRRR